MYASTHKTRIPSDTPNPIPIFAPVVNPPDPEVCCDTGVAVGFKGVGEASVLPEKEEVTGLLEVATEEVRVSGVDVVDMMARRMINPGLESSPLSISKDEAAALNRKTYLALMAKLVSGTCMVQAKFPAVVRLRFLARRWLKAFRL